MRVRVLTNALESTDVAAVHSGYAKYRRRMLQGGVELFELRRRYAAPDTGEFSVGNSAASLHAKTFSIDGRWLYIGSFNFDPRSVQHNTEIGLLLDSPPMAGQLAGSFERTVPAASYRVQLDAQGDLVWIETAADGKERRYDKEPRASFGRRLAVMFLSLLPIDSLLGPILSAVRRRPTLPGPSPPARVRSRRRAPLRPPRPSAGSRSSPCPSPRAGPSARCR